MAKALLKRAYLETACSLGRTVTLTILSHLLCGPRLSFIYLVVSFSDVL